MSYIVAAPAELVLGTWDGLHILCLPQGCKARIFPAFQQQQQQKKGNKILNAYFTML